MQKTQQVALWLLLTIVMIEVTLVQSGADMINSSDKSVEISSTEDNPELKSTFSDSGPPTTTEKLKMNESISYINLINETSDEIKINSSEALTVKHSITASESTEPSDVALSAEMKEKLLTSEKENKSFLLSEGAPSSDLLLQLQDSRVPPFPRFSEILNEETGGTITYAEKISSNFGKTKPFLELSETTLPNIETSNSEISGPNISRDSVEFSTDSSEELPLHAESFSVGYTDSDFSDVEYDSTASLILDSAATEEFLTSKSFKHNHLDVAGKNGLASQMPKTESSQIQQSSEISISSLPTTQRLNLERRDQEKGNSTPKSSVGEMTESSASLSTVEVIYENDSIMEGGNIDGSSIERETTKMPAVIKDPIVFSFEKDNHLSNEDMGFEVINDAAEAGLTINETKEKTVVVESFTPESIENIATHLTKQHVVDEQMKMTPSSDDQQSSKSTETTFYEGTDFTSEDTVSWLLNIHEDMTQPSSSEISESTDMTSDIENNSTRIPKRIQEPRYADTGYKSRPARPDPGYSSNDDSDNSPPYQPPGQIPFVDSYTPLRRESDFSRPARPDPYGPLDDFSRHAPDYSRQSSVEFGVRTPYRPQTSFARPYVPHGSFGRPYRPDRDQSKHLSTSDIYSRTTENLPQSSKSDDTFFGASQAETDFSKSSHTSGYSVKASESSEFEQQRTHSDLKPIILTPDVFNPFRQPQATRPSLNSKAGPSKPLRPVYLPSPSTVVDSDSSKPVVTEFYTRPSKSDTDEGTFHNDSSVQNIRISDKSGSYPRPGFGSNYGQPTGTSPKPFTPGTITLSRNNLTRVEYIKADCFDNHMKVSIRFNGTFNGLVYSSGYSQDPTCSYINGSGRYHYEFFIRLNRCGTLGQQEVADQRIDTVTRRRQDRAQYLVNTVTVQYNPVIEEDIDEHFRVTCEYGYDFWKTVAFPVVSVESAAMKVRTGSPVVFTLPPPQCNMEIRTGYGPSGNRVSSPVNVGDPLTLVIHMKSESAGFDILVSNCFAHNGAQKRFQLIDSNGCVVQEKLISPFRGVSSPDRSLQVTLYSYLKAFRFTGSPALYIECDVHMCHGSCPPQRCYWRHVYKRSVENATETSGAEPVISESISLFQSLEVRNDESDRPNSLAVSSSDGYPDEDLVCFRTAGFAAVLATFLILFVIMCLTSVCLCSRVRKMKTCLESTDTKHFIQYDMTSQRK